MVKTGSKENGFSVYSGMYPPTRRSLLEDGFIGKNHGPHRSRGPDAFALAPADGDFHGPGFRRRLPDAEDRDGPAVIDAAPQILARERAGFFGQGIGCGAVVLDAALSDIFLRHHGRLD